MVIENPVGVKSRSNLALGVGLTAPANLAAPSLATDLALSSTGINGSFMVYSGLDFGDDINTGNAPRRVGSGRQFPQFGDRTSAAAKLMLTWGPQDADTVTINKLKAILVDGAIRYFYIRRGKSSEIDFAATDKVEVRQVRIGGGHPAQTGDEEFDEFAWACTVIDIQAPKYDAVLGA